MSLHTKIRKLEAQIEIAKRALWHYSKMLSWDLDNDHNHTKFNLHENQHYGKVTEADQIARHALSQIHALDKEPATPLTEFAIKKWDEEM